MTKSEKQLKSELIDAWQKRPQIYLRDVLGVTKIWRLQDELLDACPVAIKEHRPIYVASGHALGKDYISSAISLWFLHSYSPSIVVQTAPTDRQVKKIMWGETLGHWDRKLVDLGGKPFADPYLEIQKNNWYLIGFTTKETGASAEASGGKFQGFHSPNICVVVSEAQAVEDSIRDQIDAIATSENVLLIFIGNPTRSTGWFAKGLKDKKNNIVFNFSCLDNPNYKQRSTVIPGLASYEWVEDKRRRWGESDPRWIGRVLGRVPDTGLNNTFPQSWVDHCIGRCGFLAIHGWQAGVAVDTAGEGADDNVIMAGKQGEVMEVYTKTLMTPTEIAHKSVELCKKIHGSFIVFDCDGVGIRDYQECCSLPPEYLRGIEIIKFHGSGPSTLFETLPDGRQRPLYANLRAEASFVTRDRGAAGQCTIEKNDKELIDDLMEETYFENSRGLTQIEDKSDIKERLGRSPGRGDAYKMLQWAFEQNREDKTYQDTQPNRLPAYAVSDGGVMFVDNQRLPSYGVAE